MQVSLVCIHRETLSLPGSLRFILALNRRRDRASYFPRRCLFVFSWFTHRHQWATSPPRRVLADNCKPATFALCREKHAMLSRCCPWLVGVLFYLRLFKRRLWAVTGAGDAAAPLLPTLMPGRLGAPVSNGCNSASSIGFLSPASLARNAVTPSAVGAAWLYLFVNCVNSYGCCFWSAWFYCRCSACPCLFRLLFLAIPPYSSF